MPSNIRGIWRRIEVVVQKYAPDAAKVLNPHAWEWNIEEVEAALRLKLPDDLKESLQAHDGLSDPERLLDIFDEAILLGSWAS